MKYQAIEKNLRRFSVVMMCRLLKVSRSGFYEWRTPSKTSNRKKKDDELAVHIRTFFKRSRKTYGSPRILTDLKEEGFDVGRKRVARIMQSEQLQGRIRKAFKKTTDSKHDNGYAPNLLNRNFKTFAPNEVWVGDITAIRTWEGWLYLATTIDLFSGKVVGYALDDEMPTELCLDALKMARNLRSPRPGLMCHTDRGVQYASKAYRAALAEMGAVQSMSRKGNCWDNAVAESFFSTLKVELIYRRTWPTRNELTAAIKDFIENFYNSQRRRSTNGNLSPVAFELDYMRTSKAA